MTPVSVQAHFGEWLQGRLGPDGPVVLITLPCPALRVAAPGTIRPPFPPDSLADFAARLRLPCLPEGVTRNFPLGIGAGASTATLVALARSAGFLGPPETLAEACLRAEKASDPLMFPEPDRLLWASREARVVQRVKAPKRAEILGGLWGAPQRTDAADMDFDDVSDLVEAWHDATDLPRFAAIASDSALRCTARRGPCDPMPELARDLGALGVMRAHTGSARGLIFAPGTAPTHGADALREAGLADVFTFRTGSP
ncbi:propanediol utilization protein [Tropicibacter sp. S64]|uniref:propanediol utilization protein n=1 Tax=Tropicibacter sp. S64 TaxID=3415122 RepID=UPI003C7A9F15